MGVWGPSLLYTSGSPFDVSPEIRIEVSHFHLGVCQLPLFKSLAKNPYSALALEYTKGKKKKTTGGTLEVEGTSQL